MLRTLAQFAIALPLCGLAALTVVTAANAYVQIASAPEMRGRVMALYGGAVPWWRVVRSDGVLLPGHELRALEAYRAEGTPLREPSHCERVGCR